MARPKQTTDAKLMPAMPQMPPHPVASGAMLHQVDANAFLRVRDSVYTSLENISNVIKNFQQDYLRQTNMLLGISDGPHAPAHPSHPVPSFEPMVAPEIVMQGMQPQMDPHMIPMYGQQPQAMIAPQALAPAATLEKDKKERKKRQVDPNAPKRPLTPYFLYMQTARPIIAADLGDGVAKGAVQEEGQRRWRVMTDDEKEGWNQAYKYNLRLYNGRVHSYKHGNAQARQMSDDDAMQYCELHNIPMPGDDAAAPAEGEDQAEAAIAEQLGQTTTIEEDVIAEHEPQKTPKAKGSRKRKEPEVEAAAPEPVKEEGSKRKRQSTKPDEKVAVEEPKKGKGKKAKSG